MEKILFFWQKLHYNVYRFNLFVSDKIIGTPFTLFLNSKYVREAYKKRGIDNPADLVRYATTRPDIGVVNWKTDIIMILLIAMIVFSMLNFITAIAGYMIWSSWSFLVYLILIGVPSVLINYYALWKDDIYLAYYKEFEKEPKQERLKWAWISFITVILILLLLIFSFWVMTNNIE